MENKNLQLWDKYKEVPKEFQKKIEAGRIKGFTSINPMWRIKSLTEEYGPCGFGWKITDMVFTNTVANNNEITVSCTLNLLVKFINKWSAPIPGTGGAKIAAMEQKGLFVSDEANKMAATDALSFACKLLGFGADIYMGGKGGDDSNKYDKPKEKASIDAENYTKYKSWLDGLEMINDIPELKKYYQENQTAIDSDSFLMDIFASKKQKLEK